MKVARLAIGIAAIGVLLPALVCGQAGLTPPLLKDNATRQAGFEYDSYLPEAVRRTLPAPAAATIPQKQFVGEQGPFLAPASSPSPPAPTPPQLRSPLSVASAPVKRVPAPAASDEPRVSPPEPIPPYATTRQTVPAPARTSTEASATERPPEDEAAPLPGIESSMEVDAPAQPALPSPSQSSSKPAARVLTPPPIPGAASAPDSSPSPSDRPAPAPKLPGQEPVGPLPVQPAAPPASECPTPPEGPWTIPQPRVLENLGIKMGGWVQQGITFNADKPIDRFNGPVVTNDRDREYQLNQAWLYFVRPTKTDGCGWDLGGRIDVVYGTDWRFGQSFGLENRIDSANDFYGLILPQFYGEVAYNDLTLKFGHFATMTAYEVVPAPLNFFYSHSYIMAGYFDPLLVTGFQADYKLGDNWTLVAGMNNGWEMFEDPQDTTNFLGGIRWCSDDKRSNLSLMVDTGTQLGFTGEHVRTSVYTVFTHKFNDRLTYGSEYVVGRESDGSFVEPGDDAQWYGMEHALIWTLNPKWSAGVRYEWVRDEDGSRIAGVGNLLQTNRGWRGLPGFTGSFQDLSLGLNYRPNKNVVFRPEVRWDWYDGQANPFGQLPFDHFEKSRQFTTAMDLIVTF